MHIVKSCAWLCLAICFAAALPAGGQDGITAASDNNGPSDKFAISPANPRLLKNSPLQFIAAFNGKITEIPVRWRTSNPGVATIDDQGNATLLAPATA